MFPAARPLALFFFALAAGSVGAAPPHPSVCRIVVQERDGMAFGSGTLIDARGEYGLVVTNWHVVRDAAGKIETVFPGGHRSEARPLKLDETWDLAALVIWRPPTEPVPLADRPPTPGDRLTICGYGQGDYRAAGGRCTDYYAPELGMPQELVELNVEARQGDSGGPIFNERGQLAGVLFGAGRGTTLGSFGGRVHAFLSTLAPDIGTPRRSAPRGAAPPPLEKPRPKAVIAHRADPTPVPTEQPIGRPAPKPTNKATSPPPQVAQRGWPKTLGDLPSAPTPVRAKQPAEWPATPGWNSKPEAAVAAKPPCEAAPIGSVDWWEDARNLLALAGIAALGVHGARGLA